MYIGCSRVAKYMCPSLHECVVQPMLLTDCTVQLLQQQFSRINELLTQFSKDATGPKGSSSHCVTDKTDIEMADSDADRQQLVEYLAPVVSSLCAVCITKLLSTKSLQHSRLLSQALPVYGGRVVSTLARRMFPGDWPVHLGASKTPISVPHDCRPDEQECLALATGLLATINLEDLVSEDELYLESVVETVAAVLCCEVLSVPTALKYVEQVIRVSCGLARTVCVVEMFICEFLL